MGIGLERAVHAAGHFGGMVGIVGAGAVDRGRPADRRQQLGVRERQRFDAAFSRRRRSLLEDAFRRAPVIENPEHGRIGRLARELGSIEHLVVSDQAGASAIGGLIGCKLVAGHVGLLPAWR
jgi:hypothetical protein